MHPINTRKLQALFIILSICTSLILLFSCTSNNEPKSTYLLFYLGGQSNMDGYGSINDLPKDLADGFSDVFIFHGQSFPDQQEGGGDGKWQSLKPGHGYRYYYDGMNTYLDDHFGVELSFAKRIRELFPDENIAIIKYSRGGTSIATDAAGSAGCWHVEYNIGNKINQYDHFKNTIHNALEIKDINGDGKKDELIASGIIWMQGESDAEYTEQIALNYQENLTGLMEQMRKDLGNTKLPVVIGKISDSNLEENGKVWDFGEIIMQAQEDFAASDPNTTIVRSTDNYGYSDPWHYDSEGYIDLGEKFAEAVYELKNK